MGPCGDVRVAVQATLAWEENGGHPRAQRGPVAGAKTKFSLAPSIGVFGFVPVWARSIFSSSYVVVRACCPISDESRRRCLFMNKAACAFCSRTPGCAPAGVHERRVWVVVRVHEHTRKVCSSGQAGQSLLRAWGVRLLLRCVPELLATRGIKETSDAWNAGFVPFRL